eukprot:gnl/MRDRNA2_/MRDRNA2_213944_c0_seq1.p1 gnl/MRDRNA2_/MRDRNA2_213944_c0~~gnl/MRDRNA2_/MRDRNA2_213944_c0_seq1.p1  ORF type:complete len:350 (+),score=73.77 gnl/MRDRNA2_/MRDRNA2_213944_c0_seq1:138-1052(+)
MFATVFPLGGLLALLQCWSEMYNDSYKKLKVGRRGIPMPGFEEVVTETWLNIFEILSVLTVVFNIALLAMAWPGHVSVLTWVLIEHGVLIFKAYLAWSIPDCPEWVVREEIEVEHAIKVRKRNQAQKLPLETESKAPFDFNGTWTCIAIEGDLHAVLEAAGTSWLKRQATSLFNTKGRKQTIVQKNHLFEIAFESPFGRVIQKFATGAGWQSSRDMYDEPCFLRPCWKDGTLIVEFKTFDGKELPEVRRFFEERQKPAGVSELFNWPWGNHEASEMMMVVEISSGHLNARSIFCKGIPFDLDFK